MVAEGWWLTWMAAARARCAQASSRSPSGRTRRIPGCICRSWLRQAAAGRLEEEQKENQRETARSSRSEQVICKHPDAACLCVMAVPSADACMSSGHHRICVLMENVKNGRRAPGTHCPCRTHSTPPKTDYRLAQRKPNGNGG